MDRKVRKFFSFQETQSRTKRSHRPIGSKQILNLASKGPVVVYPSSTIKQASKIIADNGLRRLPVVDPGTKRIDGILSTIDLVDFFGGGNKFNIIKKDYGGNFLAAINSRVSKVMTEHVVSASDSDLVEDVAQIMLKAGVGGCPVLDSEGKIMAIVSERDFIKHIAAKKFGTTVGDVMTKKVITLTPGVSIKDAARIMLKNGLRRLPVLSEGKLVGMLRTYEVLRYIAENGFAKFHTTDAETILNEKVGNVMNVATFTVKKDLDIGDVTTIMIEKRFGGFPVEDNGKIIGLVTERDIFRAIYT